MRIRSKALWLLLIALMGAFLLAESCSKRKGEPVDLVLLGGDIYTGNPGADQAQALAVKGNTILAVLGKSKDAKKYIGAGTKVIDLRGKWAVPGIIDGHVHFAAAGALINDANLMTVSDEEGLRKEVGRVVDLLDDGEWITEGLWGAYEQWALGDSGGSKSEKRAPWRPNRRMIPSHPRAR